MASQEETEVVVGEVDFRKSMEELVPSVSAGEIGHYAEVQRRFAKETLNFKSTDSQESEATRKKGKGKEV